MKLKMNSNAGCGKPATAGYLHLNVSPLNPMLIFPPINYNLYRVCLWTTQLLNNLAVHYYHILYLLISVQISVILIFSEYIVTSWFIWNLTSWAILYFLPINHIISSCAFNKSVYELLLKRMCPLSPRLTYLTLWHKFK